MRLLALSPALCLIPQVSAWGAVGHEIVATIAQTYLHPTVLPTICAILGQSPHCHISSVATWADKERMKMRWSASLHYANALDDHPSDSCAFPGPRGWAGTKGGNVLDGVKNVTSILESWGDGDASDEAASEALKFLIHFVGDMHQPLHLAGRDKGGNGVRVLWDRRHTNLHSVWDNFLLAKQVRTVPKKYSRPLPYPQIERALRGTIYDPYVRRIFAEGILDPWADELPEWLECPTPSPSVDQPTRLQQVMSVTTSFFRSLGGGVQIDPDGEVACPYFWATPIHVLNCELIWPKELDDMTFAPSHHDDDHHHHDSDDAEVDAAFAQTTGLLQLDTPEYAGVVAERMILERLLAQGGIRLAGLLNYLFAEDASAARTKFLVKPN